MRRVTFLLLIALGGCVSDEPVTTGPLPYEAELKAYAECNVARSYQFSKLKGDVFSLAVAAEGACERSRADLALAIARHSGVTQSDDTMATLKRSAVEGNAGRIARFRSH